MSFVGGGSPTSVMGDEEELIDAVVRLKLGEPKATNARVHELLTQEGHDATISQVKKAASKAMKRGFSAQGVNMQSHTSTSNEASSEQKDNSLDAMLENEYGVTMATVACAKLTSGKEISNFMSGQVSEQISVENGGLSIAEQMKLYSKLDASAQITYHQQQLQAMAKRFGGFGSSVYGTSAQRAYKHLEDAKRTGRGPGPGKAVTGCILGHEPYAARARMWVDLLLCPSGEAVLMGRCAWMTSTFIGYDALRKGVNADALEGMCAFLGLADMVVGGEPDAIGAVVSALSERADRTAPALLQWIAHQPVEQDFMYGGHWKKLSKSPATLPMSPLLHTQPAARVMNALVRVLRLMADFQTHILYSEAQPFVTACAKAAHLPATIRRLVQMIARHGSLPEDACPELSVLPAMAITTLHSMCAHPTVAATLREHPRAAQVLSRQCEAAVACCEQDSADASSSPPYFRASNSEAPRQHSEDGMTASHKEKLHCLLEVSRGGGSAACQLPVDCMKDECSHCAVRCHKMRQCSCLKVAYCDASCQRADWKVHKKTCAAHHEKKAKKAAEKEKATNGVVAEKGPLDPWTGQPLEKNATGAYKVRHLAGPDGAVSMRDIPGCRLDDKFDTPMKVLMPTEGMMHAIERQRLLDPHFDPMAQIQRLGVEGFQKRYM